MNESELFQSKEERSDKALFLPDVKFINSKEKIFIQSLLFSSVMVYCLVLPAPRVITPVSVILPVRGGGFMSGKLYVESGSCLEILRQKVE